MHDPRLATSDMISVVTVSQTMVIVVTVIQGECCIVAMVITDQGVVHLIPILMVLNNLDLLNSVSEQYK